jgi:hypothetical protein
MLIVIGDNNSEILVVTLRYRHNALENTTYGHFIKLMKRHKNNRQTAASQSPRMIDWCEHEQFIKSLRDGPNLGLFFTLYCTS